MKFAFFKIIIGVALVLGPVKAMMSDPQEDNTPSQAQLVQNSANSMDFFQEERLLMSLIHHKEDVFFEELPKELLISIFSFIEKLLHNS